MLSDEWKEIERRFEAVSRGRPVEVSSRENTFLNLDYEVVYQKATDSFQVEFTHHGHFEGAYRSIERWIRAKAERLDDMFVDPLVGYVDFRKDMSFYWILEKSFDTYYGDLCEAVARQIKFLEEVRPGENMMGEVVIESRVRALTGFLSRVEQIAKEVHRGLLSPDAIGLLRDIGLWTEGSS